MSFYAVSRDSVYTLPSCGSWAQTEWRRLSHTGHTCTSCVHHAPPVCVRSVCPCAWRWRRTGRTWMSSHLDGKNRGDIRHPWRRNNFLFFLHKGREAAFVLLVKASSATAIFVSRRLCGSHFAAQSVCLALEIVLLYSASYFSRWRTWSSALTATEKGGEAETRKKNGANK